MAVSVTVGRLLKGKTLHNVLRSCCRSLTSTHILRKPTQEQTSSSDETSSEKTTHFGFEDVLEGEKEERVYQVFENVAESYDVMNDAMSVGVHRLWKDAFIDRLGPTPGTRLIDVAGGTGDIAFRFLNYARNQASAQETQNDFTLEGAIDPIYASMYEEEDGDPGPREKTETHVTVCDINQAMLDVGKRRSERLYLKGGMSWVKGNAECLPMEDNSFDAYTIAFGIRNTTHVDKVLSEAYRVLRPGGRFMCLEFSQVTNPLLRSVYDQYSFQVIPVMGQLIAQDWKSYQYLVESIRKFPPQEEFADMIREAGFRRVRYENLTFGVAAIHSGFKL